MNKFNVTNIKWDTDGEVIDLPSEATVEAESEEDVADALSDHFGWCVLSLDVD